MFAPRRVPPCLTASVAMLKTRIKLTGPLATPPVLRTVAPEARRREKEKPVPAARLVNQRRLFDRLEDLLHRVAHRQHEAGGKLSELLAAFISVGELGRNSKLVISS